MGAIWAILRPLIFISVIGFIFTVGFKKSLLDSEVPFVVHLLTGYIPWLFFSESISSCMNSFIQNRYLVNTANFRVGLLPVIRILTTLYSHLIFFLLLTIVLFYYEYYPDIYWLQLLFYTPCLILLILSFGLLIASLRVFSKDVAEVVGIILQIGFWVTPIFWSLSLIPQEYHSLISYNPMVYIIEGYRDSLVNKIWFWEVSGFLNYLIITSFFLIFGKLIFTRLKPHFSDVI